MVDASTRLLPPGPPGDDTLAVRVEVPGWAPAGTFTWKVRVTVWPAPTVTGAGLLTVQPPGASSVKRAPGMA